MRLCDECYLFCGAAFYVEFFQHKKGQPPEYVVTAPRALRLLTRRHCDDGAAKASTRLAFSHAVAELEAVQRTREVRWHETAVITFSWVRQLSFLWRLFCDGFLYTLEKALWCVLFEFELNACVECRLSWLPAKPDCALGRLARVLDWLACACAPPLALCLPLPPSSRAPH